MTIETQIVDLYNNEYGTQRISAIIAYEHLLELTRGQILAILRKHGVVLRRAPHKHEIDLMDIIDQCDEVIDRQRRELKVLTDSNVIESRLFMRQDAEIRRLNQVIDTLRT